MKTAISVIIISLVVTSSREVFQNRRTTKEVFKIIRMGKLQLNSFNAERHNYQSNERLFFAIVDSSGLSW